MSDRATSARVARSSALERLVAELGDWATGPGPLFRQLARALARLLDRGSLPRGSRLPSERSLATVVAVSRGTAVAAYDVLVGDGLVERRPGSGTFAAGTAPVGLPPGREGSALVAHLVDRSDAVAPVIDLSLSVVHDADGLPDVALTGADLRAVEPATGYSPWGLRGLREAVADQLTARGLPSDAGNVVITTGAQQAVSLAAACWVRPGDVVVLCDPTYPGAVSAFAAAGATLVGVPVDRHGVRLEPLAEAVARHPALVYLQPTVHSPTGCGLSAHRRRAVAALVAEAGVPLVEDDALAPLAWAPPPPPVAAHDPDHPGAVLGSLSKQFWGGLRLGWVRAPEPVALRFARVKATHDLGTSAVSQVVGEHLLRSPEADRFAAERRALLRHRSERLAGALRAHLPGWTWDEPVGGLSLWVRLPRPVASAFAAVARRHGVAVATAEPLSPTGGHPDRLRLSFAAPDDDLEEAARRLAAAWQELTG